MSSPVVLITGALTGIGRAAALIFAREGARVVVSGRRDKKVKSWRRSCKRWEQRPVLFVVTSATKMICVIWWIGPRALAVWMLLSIALELRASLAQ